MFINGVNGCTNVATFTLECRAAMKKNEKQRGLKSPGKLHLWRQEG